MHAIMIRMLIKMTIRVSISPANALKTVWVKNWVGALWQNRLLNEPGEAAVLNPCYFDSDDDGLVNVSDLMNLLTVYNLTCGDTSETTASWQCGDPLGYQGYDYATVQIGEQCWFAENLRSEH